MTRTRLELLQWFGLLAAPLAWTTQLVAGFYVVQASCGNAHISASFPTWQASLTAGAAVVAVAAQCCAVVLFRELRGVEPEDAGPRGRYVFFAVASLVGNTLFLMLITLTAIGTFSHTPCQQA